MLLKYNLFIDKLFEVKELSNPDPFDEENWDEVDNDNNDDNDDDYIIDYYGNQLHLDDAIFINGDYFHIDVARWSEYDFEFYSPEDDNIIWVEYNGGDYIQIDDAKYSNKHNTYFHPADDRITYHDDDWVYFNELVYSKFKKKYILDYNSIYCENDDDFIPKDESIILEDGTYTHKENAININGKLYHKKTVDNKV